MMTVMVENLIYLSMISIIYANIKLINMNHGWEFGLTNIVLIQPQDNLLFVNDHHYLSEYEANKYES